MPKGTIFYPGKKTLHHLTWEDLESEESVKLTWPCLANGSGNLELKTANFGKGSSRKNMALKRGAGSQQKLWPHMGAVCGKV